MLPDLAYLIIAALPVICILFVVISIIAYLVHFLLTEYMEIVNYYLWRVFGGKY